MRPRLRPVAAWPALVAAAGHRLATNANLPALAWFHLDYLQPGIGL